MRYKKGLRDRKNLSHLILRFIESAFRFAVSITRRTSGAFIGAVYRRLLLIRPAGASANVRVDKLRFSWRAAGDRHQDRISIAQSPQACAPKAPTIAATDMSFRRSPPSLRMDTIENSGELFRREFCVIYRETDNLITRERESEVFSEA